MCVQIKKSKIILRFKNRIVCELSRQLKSPDVQYKLYHFLLVTFSRYCFTLLGTQTIPSQALGQEALKFMIGRQTSPAGQEDW